MNIKARNCLLAIICVLYIKTFNYRKSHEKQALQLVAGAFNDLSRSHIFDLNCIDNKSVHKYSHTT